MNNAIFDKMVRARIALLFLMSASLTLFNLSPGKTYADGESPAAKEKITLDLDRGEVVFVEVLYRKFTTSSSVRVDEDLLQKVADGECSVDTDNEFLRNLSRRLSEPVGNNGYLPMDLYWRLSLEDKAHRVIHVLYFGGSYNGLEETSAILDGRKEIVKKSLVDWLGSIVPRMHCHPPS